MTYITHLRFYPLGGWSRGRSGDLFTLRLDEEDGSPESLFQAGFYSHRTSGHWGRPSALEACCSDPGQRFVAEGDVGDRTGSRKR